MNRRKNSNILKDSFINLAVAFCALLILFTALELSLRIGGWLYSFHGRSYTHNHSVDSFQGLTVQTILCVGDSFTQGFGAGPWESYPKQLESILLRSGFRDVRVVNQGKGGISSSIALKKMPEYLDRYKPNIVFLLIGNNDNWNFEDSNYYSLYQCKFPFAAAIQQLINKSKTYKLFKISWLHLNDAIVKLRSRGAVKIHHYDAANNLNALSLELYYQGEDARLFGKDDLALGKFKQALKADQKNYRAAFFVAKSYCDLNKNELAREYLWLSISTCDDWSDIFASQISNIVLRMNDRPVGELVKIKEHLLHKPDKKKVQSALRVIDGQLAILAKEEIVDVVLTYNLKGIAGLVKEKHATLVLVTYPRPIKRNTAIRKMAIENNILLVDVERVFSEKRRTDEITPYFVSDGHCNGRGYQLMAENIAEAVLKKHLLNARNDSATIPLENSEKRRENVPSN